MMTQLNLKNGAGGFFPDILAVVGMAALTAIAVFVLASVIFVSRLFSRSDDERQADAQSLASTLTHTSSS